MTAELPPWAEDPTYYGEPDGTGPGEDTCLTCRHPDHGDEPCEALMRSEAEPEGQRCGCDDPWTARDARLAPPTVPDPWATQGPVPPPPF
jgi:hypothetical protein